MGFGLVNILIDHLQIVTTNNYNTIADFHITNYSTLSSQSAFTSRYLVKTLNDGYSSAVFSIDVSWQRIWTMNILQLPRARRICPANIPQMNCSVNCLQGNSSARTTQKIRPLYFCIGVFIEQLHSKSRNVNYIEIIALLLLRECIFRALPSNGRCLPSHCLATYICATIFWNATCFIVSVLNMFSRIKG
jgi:hypothetical protein